MKLKFNEVVGTYILRKLNNIFCGVIYCMYKASFDNWLIYAHRLIGDWPVRAHPNVLEHLHV